ncbi:carbonic anhydrase-4 [Coleophoma cylindrospora]|uniref:Carbonic anhydrase n=1 Tax=Coleophoma cylindrospora TaxID=1849047 RepID=A0A3D8QG42_9HELO|nr:carbonic anhydrase-4 [Coleophoma cylindrospora]
MPFTTALNTPYTTEVVSRDFIPAINEATPQILWVGCSDSIISETEVLDVQREQLFVHRNLGNILSNGDLSSESAVEWAVGLLQVKHIIVCGHYDCALIKSSEKDSDDALHGWYKDMTRLHTRFLNSHTHTESEEAERRKFEEVYVLAEVEWLRRQPVVKKAMEERGLLLHGFVFDRKKAQAVRLVVGGK